MPKIDLNDPKWLNLVFKNRNKKYGAYKLRKGTPKRNMIALLIIIGTITAIILCTYTVTCIEYHAINLDEIKNIEYNDMKALPPLSQGNRLSKRQSGFASHKVVKRGHKILKISGQKQEKTIIPPDLIKTNNDGSPDGTRNIGENTEGTDSSVAATEKGRNDNLHKELQALTQKTPDNQALDLHIVEQLPEFPGGWVALMKWLNKNIQYPPEALKNKVQGEVTVSFIINRNGTLSNIKIIESSHPLLNSEALRVVHKMPKWKPGIHHNKPCATMFSIPIEFHL